MNVDFIEKKINEIIAELEKDVMEIVMDETIDKQYTNTHMKPLASTKKILLNTLESIKMVEKLYQEDLEKLHHE
jgi:pyruvate dehydrogenase complex dehydrogenase (E1) component